MAEPNVPASPVDSLQVGDALANAEINAGAESFPPPGAVELDRGLPSGSAPTIDPAGGFGMKPAVIRDGLQKAARPETVWSQFWENFRRRPDSASDSADAAPPVDNRTPGLSLHEFVAQKEAEEKLLVPAPRRAAEKLGFGERARSADGLEMWGRYAPDILGESEKLIPRLRLRIDARLSELASSGLSLDDRVRVFNEEVRQGKIYYSDPAIGKAELNSIDGAQVFRVAHSASRLSLLFLAANIVSADSRHLRQYVARQHIDAGTSRTDGQRGRDVVIVWKDNGAIVKTRFLGRHRPMSAAWWSDYWEATFKMPNWADLGQGLFWGGVQFGLAATVALLQVHFGNIPEMDFTTAKLSFEFGAVIGTLASTYQNWVYRGGFFAQFLKGSVTSVLFAYAVQANHPNHVTLNPFVWDGFWTHVHITENWILNNFGKVPWQQIVRMGRDHGLFANPFRIGPWEFSRANFYGQRNYLINWTLRLLDLVKFAVAGIPVGLAVFVLSIPIAHWRAVRYAEKHQFPEALELRRKWEIMKARTMLRPSQWRSDFMATGRRLAGAYRTLKFNLKLSAIALSATFLPRRRPQVRP